MKTFSLSKKALSVFIAVLMAITTLVPAFQAFAGGVVEEYKIELFYKDGNIVPSTAEDGSNYVEYMTEGDTLQLSYQFIDCELPDNGYVKWYSETPTLVDVDQNGLVKAFDSSKGAVIHSWIDNEVKTIPLVGSLMGKAIEKALFNEYVDVDTMDTDEIIAVVEAAFGSDSPLAKYFEAYKGTLIDSLRTYLDNINSNIHATLYNADGEQLADDFVNVCVQKNEEAYANFLPNGTHITNKSNIETTVAKGSTCQLYAVTTPVRLHMGVVYTVKSSSIFTQGKVIATVDDSGLVTFKNTGTVTIMVSPDTEGFIQNLLKLINYFYQTDATGSIDSGKVADILIKYVGIDMNRTVLAAILDACFAIYDVSQDASNPVQLTATAVKLIANLILQFVYNDTITFNVVDGAPCTDFTIDGPNTVQEGTEIKLAIKDAKPVAADTSDITWASSDESVAYVDPKTGVIIGRDAGGSLGSLSQKSAVITATSAANNVQKNFTVTVTGKTGRYLSDVKIDGNANCNIGDEQDLTCTAYPSRVATANNLYVTWGLVTAGTDKDSYEYAWATDPYDETVTKEDGTEETISHDGTATDSIGKIDKNGKYTAVAGGTAMVAVKAVTGYYIKDDTFYTISSVIGTFKIFNGLPVSAINVSATGTTSGGTLTTKDVEINGVTYHYATVKKTVADAYFQNGVKALASVLPVDATNKNVKWYSDNKNFEFKDQDNSANTVDVKMKEAVEVADSANIWCVSQDGDIKSDVLTVCVTRNYATDNKINGDSFSVTNGKSSDVTHTMSFSGSWTSGAYACYDCNWYSSNEDVFTVKNKGNDNNDAVLTGVDVGTATLYCVSADGGIVDTAEITVYPDKSYLKEIVKICEDTVIKRTDENRAQYKDFSRKLDYAYYILYDEPMASQDTCDTYARELLISFYKLGGFIGLNGVSIVDKSSNDVGNFLSVNVDTTSYKSTSFDLDAKVSPKSAMYRSITWASSNSSVSVDKNGKCVPTSNDPCYSVITVKAEDYMGTVYTDSVCVAFAKTKVTGISLDSTTITGGKVGETKTLKATVSPTGTLGVGKASVGDVYWTSSNEKVASIDQNGVITFNYGGDCVITATTCDGGYTAQCAVNVVTNYDALAGQIKTYKDLNLESINYFPDTWENYQKAITDSETLIAKNVSTQPEVDAMLEKLVAAYDSLERYTYIKQAEIYLDGEAAAEFYQFDLSLLKEGISYKNAKLDLNVRLYPNGANYNTITWTSSTDKITINNEGVASPASNESCYGQITCKVTDHFGSVWTDTVWVSFAYKVVTAVKLSETNISGAIGTTHQLSASIEPTGTSLTHIGAASIQDYYWESLNPNVATVDNNGLVTFVSTGATAIRAVSYDGGIYGECNVSTSGDRNALKAAIALYKDVDYQDYEYTYGMAFKAAYEDANVVLDDVTKTQAEIDSATLALTTAGEALEQHHITKVTNVVVDWVGYKEGIGSGQKGVGKVSEDTNALSINMKSGGYNTLHYLNRVELSASALPVGADAQSVEWNVNSNKNMDGSVSGAKLTLKPTKTSDDSWAVVTATIKDSYGRTYTRTITVVMAWNVVSGVSLDQSSMTLLATAQPTKLTANVATTGSTDFTTVGWFSSDESVAKVDQSGNVTPVDIGTATITARTFDGGYIATCAVTVNADYSVLESKYGEYNTLIEDVADDYVYTPDSLAVLQETVADAKAMIDAYRSTQAQINAQIDAMNTAYAALVRYILATGVTISTDVASQSNVTEDNAGYVRYTNSTSINGKTIQLKCNTSPDGGLYTNVQWASSNSKIAVDENGLCTNNSASPTYAVVTCTITTAKGDTYSDDIYVSFVRYGVESISFADELVYGSPDSTKTVTPNVKSSTLLSNLVLSDCTYQSSDNSVATVDNTGKITFISQGTAVITATSCDGGYTATLNAYTTWDFTALQAAIASATSVSYTDYAYDYGMAFKNAYDVAVEVNKTYSASQEEIDKACQNLTEAQANLAEHPFVLPGEIGITSNGNAVANGAALEVDANAQVTLSSTYNGEMIKSASWSTAGLVNVSAESQGSNLVLTKTAADTYGTLAATITLVDDYGREYAKTISLKLVNKKVPISSFAFTYNNEEVTEVTYSCGGVYTSKSVQLGINTYPADADAYKSIKWSSTSSNLIVSDTGVVTTKGTMLSTKYTTTITCTVTLEDDTTVSNSIDVTFTRF